MIQEEGDWNNSLAVDTEVEATLERLSLEDKVRLVSGQFILAGEFDPPAGIPRFNMCDGPAGVRCTPPATTATGATALPAPIALAASWDPELAALYGGVLGLEAALTGHNVLLGPAVDIARSAVAGRTFESFGEDPLLQSRMVVPEVKAIQQHVQASLKHYLVNNQEHDRNSVDVQVDDRTLHEIYLPPFEAAIRQGGLASVMASYNQINGAFACENAGVLTQVLREEIGFRGWVISDFTANHSTAQSANAGLDWELTMPHLSYWGQQLLEAIHTGQVSLHTLNEMARRILRPTVGLGLLEAPKQGEIPLEVHAKVAQTIAERGMALLKNSDKLLPLSTAIKSIAVIGADADSVLAAGGGSAMVAPIRQVSVLQGIRQRLGEGVRVDYSPGTDPLGFGSLLPGPAAIPSAVMGYAMGSSVRGWEASYWSNTAFEGEAALTRLEPVLELNRGFFDFPDFASNSKLERFPSGIPPQFSARWEGVLEIPASGEYRFSISCVGSAKLFFGDDLVLEAQQQTLPINSAQKASHNNGIAWGGTGAKVFTVKQTLEAGQKLNVRVEYVGACPEFGFLYGGQLRLGWILPESVLTPDIATAVELAKRSEVAVVVARTLETEAMDRPSIRLPGHQADLIRAVAAANPKTVVVLMNAGPVEVASWEAEVPAILEAWYAGQEQGHALASVLFGDVNPSGKLPLTFPKSDEQTLLRTPEQYPGMNGKVFYSEGMEVGYRGYDAQQIEPQYPFGFGLSYTVFEYSNLELLGSESDQIELRFELKNMGQRAGTEVAQVYLEFPSGAGEPPRKLVDWVRVSLEPGEQRTVSIILDSQSPQGPFSIWNTARKSWEMVCGTHRVFVGSSCRDLALSTNFQINKEAL